MVRATLDERSTGELAFGPPKTGASKRNVTIPAAFLPDLREHMAEFVERGVEALIFTGVAMRRSNFQKMTKWTKVVADVGLEGFHVHDLRHTGNNYASATGANLRELMARTGHETTRVAVIYQHATAQHDRLIAEGLSGLIDRARSGHKITRDR